MFEVTRSGFTWKYVSTYPESIKITKKSKISYSSTTSASKANSSSNSSSLKEYEGYAKIL